MPTPTNHGKAKANEDRGVLLDGWKEVASYLHRGERTAKRWEQQRELPIHRVPGGARASVYANSAELDQWLLSRSPHGLDHADDVAEDLEDADTSGGSGTQTEETGSPEPQLPESSVPWSRLERWAFASFVLMVIGVVLYAVVHFNLKSTVGDLLSPASRSQKSAATNSNTVSEGEKLTAHELCLKGRYEWNYRTPENLNRALDDFTQAIVHDPGSVQAYVGMADTYILLREFSTMPEAEAYARALVAARRAVALDDSSAEAHRAIAFALTNGYWDFASGEKEFRRAIELNPSDPVARRWYANAFGVPGRFREALEQMDRAQELDPTSNATLADKGLLLYKAGRIREGIDLLRQVERADPAFRSPHFYLMNMSLVLRDYPTFLLEGQKTAQAENDPVLRNIISAASIAYARAGEKGILESLYANEKKYYQEGKFPGMKLAKTCVAMGRRQEALRIIEEEYARHSPLFVWCLSDPDLLTLKDDPKYQQLVRNINFPVPPENKTPAPVRDAPPPTMSATRTSPP
jgi:tetratricopeptide (TPR) repeat protein